MKYSFLFFMLLFISISISAQTVKDLDSLLAVGATKQAKANIERLFEDLISTGQTEKLSKYLEVFGRIEEHISGQDAAIIAVESKLGQWDEMLSDFRDKRILWAKASIFYNSQGKLEKAYLAQEKAVGIARKEKEIRPQELGKLIVDLSSIAVNRMDIPNAKKLLFEARTLLEKDPDPESIYQIDTYLGNMAYFSSKLDSAEYYYEKSLYALSQLDTTPHNAHYRPAIVLNNLSAVQNAMGESSKAIESMDKTIAHLAKYIKLEKDPAIKNNGKEFYFQGIDNLGGIYRGLGNFQKAKNLLEYSYDQKRLTFGPKSKEVWLSEILLGQLYYDQAAMEKAKSILQKGISGLNQTDGSYLFYEADAWYTLARIADSEGQKQLAYSYFNHADSLYEIGLQGDYDLIYLGFLKNYSKFLAESDSVSQAIQVANKGYLYVKENQGESSLQAFQQELGLGEVFYVLENYTQAQVWGNKAIKTLQLQFSGKESLIDLLSIERNLPQALLLLAKSKFQLEEKPTTAFISGLIEMLEEGLEAIERRKIFLLEEEDVNLLLQENEAYFEFLKKLNLEAYRLSQNSKYLKNLLTLHESSLYQKIRTQLETNQIDRFGNITDSVFEKESRLKLNLKKSLSTAGDLENYLKASRDWDNYLVWLRLNYPDYFDFRYSSLSRDYQMIQNNLPKDVDVVRYVFVDEELIALVLDGEDIYEFTLDWQKTKPILERYQSDWKDQELILSSLHLLYQYLWEPFNKKLLKDRVVLIPDGPLFNLNFEILTPKKLQDYSHLSRGTLLFDRSFSYQYSSLLFSYSNRHEREKWEFDFLAFVPEFTDKMKESYLKVVPDSFSIDKSYLTLLPQPLTGKLVETVQGMLGGKVFSGEQSTLQKFVDVSGKSKILHIGTHAYSDNLRPEYSKLIFAKSQANNTNELFAKEIYNLDLTSKLSILMACETGKPTLKPGEGMISLAHAFNYAGSESMITGLWQIDEAASSQIAIEFYKNLKSGDTKDLALRKAKLKYLGEQEGRSLSPLFWGGLVLIGNSDPVELSDHFPIHWLIYLFFILLLGAGVWAYLRNKNVL